MNYQQYQQPAPQQGYAPQPQQGYPAQPGLSLPQAYGPPQPQYAPQPQPQYQQAFPQQAQQAVAAEQPVIRGSLADAYNQGAKGGSYGNSVKFPVVGAEFFGVLARDILDTDVTPETDFATRAIKRYPDGTVRMQLRLPLDTQPGPAFPEGKATLWAKTTLLTAIIRAAVAAGYDANLKLKQGDQVWVRHTHATNTGKGNPMKEYEAIITPAGQVPAQIPAPAPAAPAAPVQVPNAPANYQLQHPEQYQFSQGQQATVAYLPQGQALQQAAAPELAAMAAQNPVVQYAQAQGFAPAQVPPTVPTSAPAPAPANPGAPSTVPGDPFAGMTPGQAAVVAALTKQPLPAAIFAQLTPPEIAQYQATGGIIPPEFLAAA